MRRMKKITLLLYNLLFVPILLILLPGYLLRIWKRGGYWNKVEQRFGFIDTETLRRIGTGRIWLHAVSVGEVGIALTFASEFKKRNPQARFLLSTTTSTGLAIAEKKSSPWLEVIANPVDFPGITSMLVGRLRPSALLMIEADFWPNRIAACTKLGIPVALLNARLSPRSEGRLRKLHSLSGPFFSQFHLITLTEKEDIPRWISLGVEGKRLRWTGNIKHDKGESTRIRDFSPPAGINQNLGDLLFLAASTHEGEEEEIARAFLSLRNEFPALRLVIAPRHVERRGEIRRKLQNLRLPCSLRSDGATLQSDVLLLDTTGELSHWYRLATTVFVGKSLPCSVNRGGQNMIEPLQAGRPVLIGPHTENFEPIASHLCEAGAAIRVTDSANISEVLRTLLLDPNKGKTMAASADKVLQPHQGATQRNCELVGCLLGFRN